MQRKKHIKSFFFLFAILFSFTVNAYNGVNTKVTSYEASNKTVHVNIPSDNDLSTDSLVFEEEETESDAEDLLSQSFLVLTAQDHTFNTYHSFSCKFSPVTLLEPPAMPRYISNGVLLI